MKKLILMLATVGAISFANAQAPAAPAKPATQAPLPVAPPATTPQVDPEGPEIKWETKNIDYGKVKQDDESNSTRYFKFTNVGKKPLIISNCHGSCGCTVPTCPTEAPIMPGKGGEIKVHYDIKRPGPFTKSVTVSSNAKTPNETLQISGTVEPKPAETTPATTTPAPTPAK
jgi:Protein of unknown function (DUF1573)